MERFGFIHEPLEVKILILYILRRLPEAVDSQTLSELCLVDEGISYFDYAQCLADLVRTGHVSESGGGYIITDKGIQNGRAIESSIPYTVRRDADSALAPVASGMKRDSMIKTSHRSKGRDNYVVELSMHDGIGEIINLRLLAPDGDTAGAMETKFRGNAEEIYQKIISLLTE